MEEFLKTKKGLEYLLETSPSDISLIDAIKTYHSKKKNGIRRRYCLTSD